MYFLNQVRNLVSRIRRRYRDKATASSFFFNYYPLNYSFYITESRTHIDFNRRFVYSRIPKAANSTIIASLYANNGKLPSIEYIENIKSNSPRLSKLNNKQVESIASGYFVFTFVRNPFVRLISCYRDKILQPTHYRSLVSRFHVGKTNVDVMLDDFLDFLLKDENRRLDAHWIPQIDLLAFPINRYNFIGSVETLQDDLPIVLKHLGINNSIVNYTPHKTDAAKFIDNLTSDQVSKIIKIYSRDFEALGYSTSISDIYLAPKR